MHAVPINSSIQSKISVIDIFVVIRDNAIGEVIVDNVCYFKIRIGITVSVLIHVRCQGFT